MSTRAAYTFVDTDGATSHVYVHHDGYPEGAAEKFALTLASGQIWPLPRYEADEFAAGFIAANKREGGSVRLLADPKMVGDLEYHYTVTQAKSGTLMVQCDGVSNWDDDWQAKTIWKGSLVNFIAKVAATL